MASLQEETHHRGYLEGHTTGVIWKDTPQGSFGRTHHRGYLEGHTTGVIWKDTPQGLFRRTHHRGLFGRNCYDIHVHILFTGSAVHILIMYDN